MRGQTHGEVLHEHEFGIGGYATRPYAWKTIRAYQDSVRAFYEKYETLSGKGEGQNPGYSIVVNQVMRALGFVLGKARLNLPDAMQPWVVVRILSTLRADDVEAACVALLFSHGIAIGERPGSHWVRDHNDYGLSERGVEIWRKHGKSDQGQVSAALQLAACSSVKLC